MQPNILWICPDQQRYDTIHALGNEHIKTPNLDKLASEGVSFMKTYCQSPVCSPSRASFLSGQYPGSVHVNTNGSETFPDNVELITKLLADAGYDCGLAGKLHIASAWTGHEKRTDDGYRYFQHSLSHIQHIGNGNNYTDWILDKGHSLEDVFVKKDNINAYGKKEGEYKSYRKDIPLELHQTTWCIEKALDFIKEKRKSPWLMSINMFDPHPPFDNIDEYFEMYPPEEMPTPLYNEGEVEYQNSIKQVFFQGEPKKPDNNTLKSKAAYYGSISLIDKQVGRLMDYLEKSGEIDNTIIIFTSDHGEMLGDHGLIQKGCRFYEGAVHVPLIISWKGHFQKNIRCNELVELTDIAPTLAEICGCKLKRTDGRSLVPLLTGDKNYEKHRDYVRCEYYNALNMFAPYEPEKNIPTYANMYFDGKYKLITYHTADGGELYDLDNDPNEFDNLWHNEEYTKIKFDLLKKSYDASIVCADPGSRLIGRY